MKKLINISILFFSISIYAQKEYFTLTVKINNIQHSKGEIRMALYNQSEKFTKIDKTYRYACIPQLKTN